MPALKEMKHGQAPNTALLYFLQLSILDVKEIRFIFSLLQYQYNTEVHLWYWGHLTTSDWAVTAQF